MNDIFISYASSDRPIAEKFAHALEANGWSVWWDREIPVGKSFDQVIEEQLTAARCIVVLWSKAAVRSRWVKAESGAAADRDRLVPVLIDDAAIPLEFKRIQTAMLANWDGDVSQPEFGRLLEAIRDLIARPETNARPLNPAIESQSPPLRKPALTARKLWPLAIILFLIVGTLFVKNIFRKAPQETSTPAAPPNQKPQPAETSGVSAPASTPDAPKQKPPVASSAFSIKIGDKIDDGVPAPGAGNIDKPYAQEIYSFAASAGQRVYFRMLHHSNGLGYIRWRLADPGGMEIFNTCLGCSEPGVQTLTNAGTYNLTVGSDNDASTGTYQLKLFDVPPPSRFTIKIGDQIKENTPGPGAGIVESPGAEDIYTFTAAPRQNVYFRMFETSTGMGYIKWRLADDNGMEIFNTCLGCSEPGVQTLINGGDYTLTIGNRADPSTGSYRVQLFNVPPANQFALNIGDKVRPASTGAGVIESPGAEDIYTFSATPGQKVYFHLLEHDRALDYIKWRLIDENNVEVFNTCLGCSDPGVQTLSKGGKYMLVVGNRANPGTGNYAFETGQR